MPNPRLTQIVAELPFEKKIVGVGTLAMVVSLFFPWYQDLDSFHTGDTFTGLTGPMYFAGFTFLVLASLSLLVMVMDHLNKQLPIFKVKTSLLHLWSGIFSFYLLFLVGTAYFHPAFGVNITMKQSGFGMFIAYAAAAMLTIGGYLEGRGRAAVKDFEKETREDAVALPPVADRKVVHPMIERKPREIVRSTPAKQRTAEQPAMELEADSVQASNAQRQPQPLSSQQPVPAAPVRSVPAAAQRAESESDRPVQPYRMDL